MPKVGHSSADNNQGDKEDNSTSVSNNERRREMLKGRLYGGLARASRLHRTRQIDWKSQLGRFSCQHKVMVVSGQRYQSGVAQVTDSSPPVTQQGMLLSND